MFFSGWNIGLEIHNNYFLAIALQKKRSGWQLRGWWQVYLQQPIFNQQGLFNPKLLTTHLRQWRKLLPKSISLRLVLPSHLVLQHPLKLPPQLRTTQELSWYVNAAVGKLFPLPANELVIDYRKHIVDSQTQLLITATRRTELSLWISALKHAGLVPEVIDIPPCILRVIAHYAAVPEDNLLIHWTEDGCLLVSPLKDDFYFEYISQPDWPLSERKTLACQRYNRIASHPVNKVSISGNIANLPSSTDIQVWSPFSAIQHLQPPIPKLPSLFTIPCGLALREPDYDTSQSTALA